MVTVAEMFYSETKYVILLWLTKTWGSALLDILVICLTIFPHPLCLLWAYIASWIS